MPVILETGKLRQEALQGLAASLGYKVSSKSERPCKGGSEAGMGCVYTNQNHNDTY